MKRTQRLARRTDLKRRTPIRTRSPRRLREAGARRQLVVAMLEAYPSCTARLDGCTGRADDVHEVVSRARGGDYLDDRICLTLCRRCHDAVPALPPEIAAALGLLFPSGTDPRLLTRTATGGLRLESERA